MGVFEVVGVVSGSTGEPLVQISISTGEDKVGFQIPASDARTIAQDIQEAATNAVYESALLEWAKDRDPTDGEALGAHLIDSVRRFRADRWGLPDKPDDWAPEASGD
jgi:hypothetical protein